MPDLCPICGRADCRGYRVVLGRRQAHPDVGLTAWEALALGVSLGLILAIAAFALTR